MSIKTYRILHRLIFYVRERFQRKAHFTSDFTVVGEVNELEIAIELKFPTNAIIHVRSELEASVYFQILVGKIEKLNYVSKFLRIK